MTFISSKYCISQGKNKNPRYDNTLSQRGFSIYLLFQKKNILYYIACIIDCSFFFATFHIACISNEIETFIRCPFHTEQF